MATKYVRILSAVGDYVPGDEVEVGRGITSRQAYQHARRGRVAYFDKQARPAESDDKRLEEQTLASTSVESTDGENEAMSALEAMDYSDLWSLYGDLRDELGIEPVKSRKRASLIAAIAPHWRG